MSIFVRLKDSPIDKKAISRLKIQVSGVCAKSKFGTYIISGQLGQHFSLLDAGGVLQRIGHH